MHLFRAQSGQIWIWVGKEPSVASPHTNVDLANAFPWITGDGRNNGVNLSVEGIFEEFEALEEPSLDVPTFLDHCHALLVVAETVGDAFLRFRETVLEEDLRIPVVIPVLVVKLLALKSSNKQLYSYSSVFENWIKEEKAEEQEEKKQEEEEKEEEEEG